MRKTYKALSALFLVFCMALSWMIPAASAAESEQTDLVQSAVAAEDVVPEVKCSDAATAVVNGHDYMYMFCGGQIMLVYDLDTGELVDKQTNAHSTTRDVYVDAEGIVWACGSAGELYRYDPYTKTGEMITIPAGVFVVDSSFNAHGITGDENGMIYFGTYNRCYVGMYNPKTGEFKCLTEELKGSALEPDGQRGGFGGVVLKDGYAYLGIDGDKNSDGVTTHDLLKVKLDTGEVVHHIDLYPILQTKSWMEKLGIVGDDVLLGSTYRPMDTIAVDISGEKMELIQIEGMPKSFNGAFSGELNGKVYMMGANKEGLLEYDIATRTVTETGIAVGTIDGNGNGELLITAGTGGWVTIDGLPGQTLVTFKSVNDQIDLVFYNIETKQVVTMEDYTNGVGAGRQLRALAQSPDGKQIYIGAYGSNKLAVYDVESGKITDVIPTSGGQVEGVIWYDGYVYVGNYSDGSMTQVDLQTGTARPLFYLKNTAFNQVRMHAMTAGDGKVFLASAPNSNRYGGVLTWYNIDEERAYIAAGPNPEDVYYTIAGDVTGKGWRSAVTGELADFDEDDNGSDDSMITVDGKSVQRFTGVIKNQTINYMTYKDGYIYGSTSKHGGSSTKLDAFPDCSVIFVYDVAAMKVIATYDLCNAIDGLAQPVNHIDLLEQDPDVPGKFWGVVSDTLFSCTFDMETKTFHVTEELSLGKAKYATGGDGWDGRNIIFDGDFLFVSFGQNGTYMIEKANPENYYQLTSVVTKHMTMAPDGNIYYINNHKDFKVLYTAQTVADIKVADPVCAKINAIGEVTLDSEAAIKAARTAYEALTDAQKALVNTDKLTAAEAKLAELKKAAADQAAADAVTAKIEAIGTVTLESEAAITEARTAYDGLTEDQKALVDETKLTAAEAKLAELKAAAEKEAADKTAADAVIAQIKAIGTVTKDSKEVIKAARTAYEALTEDQKALVTNLDVLEAAEDAYAELIKDATNPDTGDSAPVVLLTCMLVVSMAALTALATCNIRKKRV